METSNSNDSAQSEYADRDYAEALMEATPPSKPPVLDIRQFSISELQSHPDFAKAAIDLLEKELTEQRTDEAISFIVYHLPPLLKPVSSLIRLGLDYALPEHLIAALRTALKVTS